MLWDQKASWLPDSELPASFSYGLLRADAAFKGPKDIMLMPGTKTIKVQLSPLIPTKYLLKPC